MTGSIIILSKIAFKVFLSHVDLHWQKDQGRNVWVSPLTYHSLALQTNQDFWICYVAIAMDRNSVVTLPV